MEAISYKLPVFEGPLDLLLQLVQKNKLNICDIPIAEVLQQYMDTISLMQEQDMEVASEFLDMAARLVYIKSVMLLPKTEEDEDPRDDLARELISYQLCQEAARRLAMHNVGQDLFIRVPEEVEPDLTYKRKHEAEVLLSAYISAAGRGKRRLPPSEKAFSALVNRKIVSVKSKIGFILRKLYIGKNVAYTKLFETAESRSDLVATFLALLELVKMNRVKVEGEGNGQSISMLGTYREGDEAELIKGLTVEDGD
ncbi:MAG: segregation/condensation protein A [Clostridia bacterium]|nr:segregation/condensation protein A [Clostridia bacterium]